MFKPSILSRMLAVSIACAMLPACADNSGSNSKTEQKQNSQAEKSDKADSRYHLQNIYEPSGAIQLSDGRVLVVEDEAKRAFNLLSFEQDGNVKEDEAADAELMGSFKHPHSDLEALAQDPQGWIYTVSSHSETKQNERLTDREHFLRFKINGNKAEQISYAPNLKDALGNAQSLLQSIKKQTGRTLDFHTMNVEGMHYDQATKRLLLGFRDPLSMIVPIENPDDVFGKGAAPRFGEPVVLKLQGGGIRSLTYDPVLKAYLLANEVTGENGKGQSQLWTWDGKAQSAPVALNLPENVKLKNIEAVESVTLNGKPRLLLMGDEGSVKKQRPARYLLIDYADLNK
ncbi:Protein of uncharacterised function (DUF3616) [Neisseria zoodegmatis]|uniref:Protein of uncharacterized function (DUF3616) n=1 Tax=Neisseria zoodegmatis TaxID=326523 RepID=A0A378X5D7_9NEIS|nr:hypothetical protein [Neisseria zoodegmatis]SUA48830.1 Protein of uncharacterised function (DUF3616) [Neisseria zoodegmatis]